MLKAKNRFTIKEQLSITDIDAVQCWHLVRTPGDKVLQAAGILDAMGLVTWTPLTVKYLKVGRGRMKLRKRPVNYPAYFNYLFIGIQQSTADWPALFHTGYIRAVVSVDTRNGVVPYRIPKQSIDRARKLLALGKFDARRLGKKLEDGLKVGSQVRVINEGNAWWGHKMRVKSLESGSVCVVSELLGKSLSLEIALDDVSLCG